MAFGIFNPLFVFEILYIHAKQFFKKTAITLVEVHTTKRLAKRDFISIIVASATSPVRPASIASSSTSSASSILVPARRRLLLLLLWLLLLELPSSPSSVTGRSAAVMRSPKVLVRSVVRRRLVPAVVAGRPAVAGLAGSAVVHRVRRVAVHVAHVVIGHARHVAAAVVHVVHLLVHRTVPIAT